MERLLPSKYCTKVDGRFGSVVVVVFERVDGSSRVVMARAVVGPAQPASG